MTNDLRAKETLVHTSYPLLNFFLNLYPLSNTFLYIYLFHLFLKKKEKYK